MLIFEADIMNHITTETPLSGSIGIFDSGYGGLTVLKAIVQKLPQYNYIYLGDNARAPYGNRSFETVYQYTLQCVKWLLIKVAAGDSCLQYCIGKGIANHTAT